MKLKLPIDYYDAKLDTKTTLIAVTQIKDSFEKVFYRVFKFQKISAPLIIPNESSSSWLRYSLKKYGFDCEDGVYTSMICYNSQKEIYHNFYSKFLDRWQFEKIISSDEENIQTLNDMSEKIFTIVKITESYINDVYPILTRFLPMELKFITLDELNRLYPDDTPMQREEKIAYQYKAVFITKTESCFDDKNQNYHDWYFSGKLIAWYPILDCVFEIAKMGIRANDEESDENIEETGVTLYGDVDSKTKDNEKEKTYSIGGVVGMSRLCMFLLGKAHIGEVQSLTNDDDIVEECKRANINLL